MISCIRCDTVDIDYLPDPVSADAVVDRIETRMLWPPTLDPDVVRRHCGVLRDSLQSFIMTGQWESYWRDAAEAVILAFYRDEHRRRGSGSPDPGIYLNFLGAREGHYRFTVIGTSDVIPDARIFSSRDARRVFLSLQTALIRYVQLLRYPIGTYGALRIGAAEEDVLRALTIESEELAAYFGDGVRIASGYGFDEPETVLQLAEEDDDYALHRVRYEGCPSDGTLRTNLLSGRRFASDVAREYLGLAEGVTAEQSLDRLIAMDEAGASGGIPELLRMRTSDVLWLAQGIEEPGYPLLRLIRRLGALHGAAFFSRLRTLLSVRDRQPALALS